MRCAFGTREIKWRVCIRQTLQIAPFASRTAANPATPWYVAPDIIDPVTAMSRNASVVLYVLVLIGVVVGVDLLFLKHQFWLRLIVNIGIVLVFLAFYIRFVKNR